ncbi:claudin domain-containing protein 2 isoform X1 [Meriones unguiculatus]|uniref:claudin domain-containing protein 2 isoform X1 n=1 Tax=Meriones unguiculatus TaxID=10047 RepID=UPI00293F0E9E|nr:claudin domain-containing protein 2 isoform X1 [Meriones unguiculatus]
MGVKRSLQIGGNLLNILTSVLTILSTATNYWSREQGGHSGLWQECSHGTCTNIPCQNTLAVTAACMVLAATFSTISLGMGIRIQCQEGQSLRSQKVIALLFLSGLLLLIALIGYTARNAWKPEVFFSWSYFFGWLLLSAGGHDLAEHRSHRRVSSVPVNAACLGQNKGMAFSAGPACFSAERGDTCLKSTGTQILWLVES